MIFKFDRQLPPGRKGGVAIRQLTTCCHNLCKARAGLLFGAALFIMLSSACNDSCAEDDGRNIRKNFSIDSPTFPNITDWLQCPIPENPAALLFTSQDEIPTVFGCADVSDDAWSNHWLLELRANSQCADGDRNEEWFRPEFPMGATCYYIDTDARDMPISTVIGGIDFFTMCPDVYRSTIHGHSDYHMDLYLRSPVFAGIDNCAACIDGYVVRFYVDQEFTDVDFNDNDICYEEAFSFINPMSSIVDCR